MEPITDALGVQLVAASLLGYITVPLVSLATRRHWAAGWKFLVALALSAAGAFADAAIRGDLSAFDTIFPTVFTAQQVAWNLKLPGLGGERVNARLAALGSPTDLDGDDGAEG